jgi:hypothetical protein
MWEHRAQSFGPPRLGLFGISTAVGWALLCSASCSTGEPFHAADNAAGGTSGSGSGSGGATPATGGAGTAGQHQQTGEAGESHEAGGDASAGGASTEPQAGAGGSDPLSCPANSGDCNEDPDDGCETALDTATDCGACGKACSAPTAPFCAKVSGKYTCTNPAQVLLNQRAELPCVAEAAGIPELCESVAMRTTNCPQGGKVVSHTVTIGGKEGATYDVSVRIRGVLEPKVYTGGKDAGNHFYIGGTAHASNYNIFSIAVSAPAQTYFLNSADADGELYRSFSVDHTQVIPIKSGATVTLQIVDPDCALVRNCQSFTGACSPYVLDGIPPAPAGFNGQFVHLDVIKVVARP